MSIQSETRRINVTLPVTLLDEFRALVPKRQRNEFIVAVLAQELQRLKLEQVLQESSGSWPAQDYPALATPAGVDAYIREMRASYRPRSWDQLVETEGDD